MPPRSAQHTEDSRWFRLSIAAGTAASTALIVVVLYVLSQAADDLKSVKDGLPKLAERVSLNERDIANNSANDIVVVKRVGRLEGRVFMMNGQADAPAMSVP